MHYYTRWRCLIGTVDNRNRKKRWLLVVHHGCLFYRTKEKAAPIKPAVGLLLHVQPTSALQGKAFAMYKSHAILISDDDTSAGHSNDFTYQHYHPTHSPLNVVSEIHVMKSSAC